MLAVVLYVLLKPVNKTLSLIAAISRLAMTTIHGLNLLNYYFILLLVGGTGYVSAFEPEQINALVTLFLDGIIMDLALASLFSPSMSSFWAI